MPFVVRKVANKPLYSVKNAKTGKVHSYGSTKSNALAQVRILHSKEKK